MKTQSRLTTAGGDGSGQTTKAASSAATRKRILDSAERLFANLGFEGTSMRLVAGAARVAQGLIHYHFDTKEQLFEEVFKRRSEEINSIRSDMLDEAFSRNALTIETYIEALLRPTLILGHDRNRGGGSFSRILTSTAADERDRSRGLIQRNYDPTARRFIKALRIIVPGFDEAQAVWGYLLVISVGLGMMSRTGRANTLSGGLCDDTGVEEMMARIVPFVAAGLRALAADVPASRRSPRKSNLGSAVKAARSATVKAN